MNPFPGTASIRALSLSLVLALFATPAPVSAAPDRAGTGLDGIVAGGDTGATAGRGVDAPDRRAPGPKKRKYPKHTGIVATTFWVGELFDPSAEDGSQMISTYDDNWYANYGGCDGRIVNGECRTEKRFKKDGWFPRHMTPLQNPFYLDLPYDDLNDPIGFRHRGAALPWAHDKLYRRHVNNPNVSLMKNRWVKIRRKGRVCYGQIQDAGPGEYHDAAYVFGRNNARPANKRYNNAGMDVSPALNGCLGFSDLNGQDDRVTWKFVQPKKVPKGPWKRIVTKTPRLR